MIEEITIKNVLSYKNEVTFSFEATDDTTFESSHVVTMPNGTRLLKLGIIYGPNAGGKSNLLYAIDNLLEFWLSDYKNLDIPTPFEPFLLDQETPSQPSEYSLKFWVNNVRYWYQLHATSKSVIYEKLSYYKTTQPIKVFERELKDDQSIITFNPAVQKISQEEQKIISLYCLPNKSLFAVRGNVNIKIEHVDVVRKWIHTQFMQMIRPTTNMMHYSQRKIQEDSNFKEYILDFLNLADFNISGLNDHLEKKQIPEQAKKIFLEAETINPDNLGAKLCLADIYSRNSAFDEAEKRYKRLIELTPQNYAIYNNYAEMLHRQKRLTEAMDIYRQAVILNPKSAETSNNLGAVLRELEEYDEALGLFFKAAHERNGIELENIQSKRDSF